MLLVAPSEKENHAEESARNMDIIIWDNINMRERASYVGLYSKYCAPIAARCQVEEGTSRVQMLNYFWA